MQSNLSYKQLSDNGKKRASVGKINPHGIKKE